MKIVIIGSIKFYPEYLKIKKELEEKGHSVIIPKPNEFYHVRKIGDFPEHPKNLTSKHEGFFDGESNIKRKTMEEFNEYLADCDVVIIANFDKDGKKNYIGVNSLMEIGIAFNRNKKIFILNSIPTECKEELNAIGAIELNGDLTVIK